ncbi:Acetophenone carboxylase gamma subunit [Synechococcus sp. MIT S9509]|uniref:hydantoinase B/oxoprolinase family protein n=1 Tax=unclassified Synechococcus TaxID=2626047 RepID=UPI0007BB4871|nr:MULTISPECIES: hydantoinase B/oxoprolinase family protein [unclassified Synechococcus]KZR85455.1 Acetophenone carboxylase gamma subunit [Synechococcus sp. MIT S9504]KZR89468.1 Acetophenone carboxylase gamma subunit [Synechococcus sp. MIT S9509]
MNSWQFWIDRGGTFTDLVARNPSGQLLVRKVLSEQPDVPGDPAVAAMRELMQLTPEQRIDPGLIEELRLGTTVATNALLEGAGEPVLLVTNRGLADLLLIGDQHRQDLFALAIAKPPTLLAAVEEVPGRLDADGRELEALLLEDEFMQRLERHHQNGIRCCAIALMHAWRDPIHEKALAQLVRSAGFRTVVCSHEASPLPRLVPRGQTTVVEAAVRPVLSAYLDQVQAALGDQARLRVMTSSGALQHPDSLLAKDTILSGPAGGMIGAVAAAQQAGLGASALVGVDMGGTSTDVFCLPSGAADREWERNAETEIAGYQLTASRLPIHTVAAGGGSIISAHGGRLTVGPRSAGAEPGPACYRRGGPLAITDAHLLLGRLQVDAFPAVFGPDRDQPPDLQATRQQFQALSSQLGQAPEQLAEGALDLAVEAMAGAIRHVSLFRGHDIRGGVLVAYGGAAGQLACRLAESLGLRQVLLHPLAGVLSAYGLGQARQRQLHQRSIRRPLDATLLTQLPAMVRSDLSTALVGLQQLSAGSSAAAERQIRIELRDASGEQGLMLSLASGVEDLDLHQLETWFDQAHRLRFGYTPPRTAPLIAERLEVEVLDARAESSLQSNAEGHGTEAHSSVRVQRAQVHWREQGWCDVPVLERWQLKCDQQLSGPALILDPTASIVLEPGWKARLLDDDSVLLEGTSRAASSRSYAGTDASGATDEQDKVPDPVDLSLFHHRFMQIAERMGERLRQTSRSVNMRERLDFSCALFDSQGALVANAPHIPVHLGSMSDAVVDLLEQIQRGERPALAAGDTVISNDPFHGGTHLPDITAITPCFVEGDHDPFAFVACRGHHADVGGLTPGSMPPFSSSIEEEGLLVRNHWLSARGTPDRQGWNQFLQGLSSPPRDPELLWADLQAQAAANHLGTELFDQLLQLEGCQRVRRYLQHVQDHAAATVRRLIDRFQDSTFEVDLDNGARLKLALKVDRKRQEALLNFCGTSPQGKHNFHAPLAVTKAAVLYVIRCLVEEPIPLNAGCFQPLTLIVPEGSLLNPSSPAAVVGGNVETSQALCNLLFASLGVMAAAQGTMNNLTFGDGRRQYYETIAGGGGAGQGFAGSSGVQTHMTNSRLTDPEILEQRFPVRLERFGFRRGSGGVGRWPGGDGLEREFRFLEPMTAALLSGSRIVAPFGLAGGEPGAAGTALLTRADGTVQELDGCVQLQVNPGDRLLIGTPGGGGFEPLMRSGHR